MLPNTDDNHENFNDLADKTGLQRPITPYNHALIQALIEVGGTPFHHLDSKDQKSVKLNLKSAKVPTYGYSLPQSVRTSLGYNGTDILTSIFHDDTERFIKQTAQPVGKRRVCFLFEGDGWIQDPHQPNNFVRPTIAVIALLSITDQEECRKIKKRHLTENSQPYSKAEFFILGEEDEPGFAKRIEGEINKQYPNVEKTITKIPSSITQSPVLVKQCTELLGKGAVEQSHANPQKLYEKQQSSIADSLMAAIQEMPEDKEGNKTKIKRFFAILPRQNQVRDQLETSIGKLKDWVTQQGIEQAKMPYSLVNDILKLINNIEEKAYQQDSGLTYQYILDNFHEDMGLFYINRNNPQELATLLGNTCQINGAVIDQYKQPFEALRDQHIKSLSFLTRTAMTLYTKTGAALAAEFVKSLSKELAEFTKEHLPSISSTEKQKRPFRHHRDYAYKSVAKSIAPLAAQVMGASLVVSYYGVQTISKTLLQGLAGFALSEFFDVRFRLDPRIAEFTRSDAFAKYLSDPAIAQQIVSFTSAGITYLIWRDFNTLALSLTGMVAGLAVPIVNDRYLELKEENEPTLTPEQTQEKAKAKMYQRFFISSFGSWAAQTAVSYFLPAQTKSAECKDYGFRSDMSNTELHQQLRILAKTNHPDTCYQRLDSSKDCEQTQTQIMTKINECYQQFRK